MYTRILTYDLKYADSYDYKELYDYLKKVNATQLTESSYLIKSSLKYEDFANIIKSITKSGDNVKCIVLSTKDTLSVWTIR